MQYEVRVRIYTEVISEQIVGEKRKNIYALDHHIIGERCSVHRPHVHGTRSGPVPTKPAGTMADESTENVHRFARKSPDTLLRLACDTHSFYKKLKNVSCEYDRLNG